MDKERVPGTLTPEDDFETVRLIAEVYNQGYIDSIDEQKKDPIDL